MHKILLLLALALALLDPVRSQTPGWPCPRDMKHCCTQSGSKPRDDADAWGCFIGVYESDGIEDCAYGDGSRIQTLFQNGAKLI